MPQNEILGTPLESHYACLRLHRYNDQYSINLLGTRALACWSLVTTLCWFQCGMAEVRVLRSVFGSALFGVWYFTRVCVHAAAVFWVGSLEYDDLRRYRQLRRLQEKDSGYTCVDFRYGPLQVYNGSLYSAKQVTVFPVYRTSCCYV